VSDALAGVMPEESAGAGRRLARIAVFALFAAFTVWINYEVKFAMRQDVGTVTALGDLAVGAPAPDFSLTDLEGATVSLAAMRPQKMVLIEFWATWCPPCRMVLATLQRMEQSLRDHDVEVLSINQGEAADAVRHYVEQEGTPFHVVLDADGTVAQRYRVMSLPTMLLIDRRGVVRWIHVGHMPDTDDLRDVIERLGKE
jgi:peroxiredoxin